MTYQTISKVYLRSMRDVLCERNDENSENESILIVEIIRLVGECVENRDNEAGWMISGNLIYFT